MTAGYGHTAATGGARKFHTLDGLRGVAAIAVAIYHGYALFGVDLFPSGYLAVDLFFVLSGFVIAHAYEHRLAGGMSLGGFLLTRAIRLYPLFLAGAAIGFVYALALLATGRSDLSGAGVGLALLTGLLFLPSFGTIRETSHVFPINGPAWSLFFEVIANLLHALTWRFLTVGVLIVVVALSAAALVATALTFGHLDVGWQWTSFWGGLPRLFFSYALGVLFYRLYRGGRTSGWGPWALLAVTVPAFAWARGDVSDLVCVMVLFPAVVWLAVRVEPGRRSAPVFKALGQISYPLYAIHFPVLHFVERALGTLGEVPQAYTPWAGLAAIAGLVVVSWALARFFDEPVRARLQAMRRPRLARPPQEPA